MGCLGFGDLKRHIGHKIECTGYGLNGRPPYDNIAIECEDCREVLFDFDAPPGKYCCTQCGYIEYFDAVDDWASCSKCGGRALKEEE